MQKKFYSEQLEKEFDSEEEMRQTEHDDLVTAYLEESYGERYKDIFTEEEIKKCLLILLFGLEVMKMSEQKK